MTEKQPGRVSRISALLLGSMYLVIMAGIFAEVTETPLIVATTGVVLGATAIVSVFAILAGRLVRSDKSNGRFGLSSVMLLFVPLSIYLAAIRILFGPVVAQPLPFIAWLLLAIGAIVLVLFSTVILLRMAEAVIWVAVGVARARKAKNRLPVKRQAPPR